jgi:hypothetical protein
VTEASVPTPAATYMMADCGRPNALEAFWINNVRGANFSLVAGLSAPGNGASCDPGAGNSSNCYNDGGDVAPWQADFNNSAIYRHQMGSTLVYCDGHAKWHNRSQIWSGDPYEDGFDSPEGSLLQHPDGTQY